MLGDSLEYTNGNVLGSDEVIKLGYTDVKVIGNILVDVDMIKPGFDAGTDLGSFGGSFDGSNYGKLKGLLLG